MGLSADVDILSGLAKKITAEIVENAENKEYYHRGTENTEGMEKHHSLRR